MNIIAFIVGFITVIILNIVYYMIINYKDKREFQQYKKWWNDPSTEEFLYDENGEKIWSNKRGCIGPATYIKKR